MRRIALVISAAALSTAAVGTAVAQPWSTHSTAETPVSAPAADVLARPAVSSPVRLLSFLNTQPDSAATPSRSQAVEDVSLLSQYGGKGLAVEIVDESGAGHDALTNTYYDWNLGQIRLVGDTGRTLATQYSVTSAPTTLLLDAGGTVLARWDSYVLTATVAQNLSARLPAG